MNDHQTSQLLRAGAAAAASIALALAAAACDKPARPLPHGPGATADKLAAKVEDLPKVAESAKNSTLTAEQRAIVVARVGDRPITLGDLEARLQAEPNAVRSQFASVQKRKEYLAKLVQFEVLVAEALRQGIDKDPEVLETTRQAMVRKYLMEEGKDEVDPAAVPAADVKAYYDANPGVFHKPETVELSHMLFADKAQADKVKVELEKGAEGNTPKLVALWNDYVVRLSEDKATAPYLGALGSVSRQPPPGATSAELERRAQIPQALMDAAFAVEPFVVGPVVQSERGFHVWMTTSRSPAVEKSLEQAEESIRARIAKRERDLKRQKLIDDLKAKAKVTIDDDAVRLIVQPKVEAPPPKKPSGNDAATPPAAATSPVSP
ncbi:MAG: peptidyl-prolyl cis-trans isomerase [Deltaproteobacteria bacterium]|nr:peptidyl-prolyl cis-trans isomerase [Deltaproteobacteria bacterium]